MAEDPGAPNQDAFAGAPPAADAGSGPPPDGDAFAERPELFVGGAFVGGFALAMLLKRLGS
jgi:hypothetical protein